MGRGGARPNSGRKPSVIAPEKISKAQKRAREEKIEELTPRSTLYCPSYLTETAKKEWHRVMKFYKMMDAKILCGLDVAALAMYCEAWAIYKTAQQQWTEFEQEGIVASDNPGVQKQIDACIKIMNKQAQVVSSLSEQLCLTPVGRARMGVSAAKQKEDALIKFLSE